jgi:ABC-type uncharacterized transport system auxiliary subunit
MMSRSLGLLFVLSATACIGAQPALERYRLAPVELSSPGRSSEPSTGVTVAVEPYDTPGIFGDPQIVYRLGDTEYGSYPNREWALPLSTMLAQLTAEALRESAGARVLERETAGAATLVWRGGVREFEEVNRGADVSVAVHLDGTLARAVDDSVLWQGSARVERPVRGDSMPEVIRALSEAAASALDSLVAAGWPVVQDASR